MTTLTPARIVTAIAFVAFGLVLGRFTAPTHAQGAGKVFEKLPSGRNCVQADVFRVDGTNEAVPPVRWCFNVT